MPKPIQMFSDFELVEMIQADKVDAFAELYDRYFSKLFNHAYQKTGDRFLAQEVIQELFISFWEKRHSININGSIASYFFGAVRFLVINQFRKKMIYEKHLGTFIQNHEDLTNETIEWLQFEDLNKQYDMALQTLPEKCREIFVMSRNGNSNKEIAEKLNISVKTVEQYITKALRTLRLALQTHLNLLISAMATNFSDIF